MLGQPTTWVFAFFHLHLLREEIICEVWPTLLFQHLDALLFKGVQAHWGNGLTLGGGDSIVLCTCAGEDEVDYEVIMHRLELVEFLWALAT